MSNKPLNLTRNQLSEFLLNTRAIRVFEQLLKSVGGTIPSDVTTLNQLITETSIEASNATQRSNQALDTLNRIARSLELLAVMPSIQQLSLSELTDISSKIPIAGNIVIYDATLKIWKNATLTPGTDVTIANTDGAITINSMGGAVSTHAATSKATPVDADEMPLVDSAASFGLKKLTWANLKSTLAAWINGGTLPASFTTLKVNGDVIQYGTVNAFRMAVQNAYTRFMGGTTVGSDPVLTLYGSTHSNAGLATFDASSTRIRSLAGSNQAVFSSTGLAVTGTMTVTGGATMLKTSSALTNGAGAAVGTLNTAPIAGNPTKWIGINDNGTTRYIPSW